MKRKTAYFFLFFLIILSLGSYAFFFSSADVIPFDDFFTFRQVDQISSQGVPLLFDTLSYQGRFHPFTPFYFYLATIISLISSTYVVLLLSLLLFAGFLLVLFFFVQRIYRRYWLSIFIVFLASTTILLVGSFSLISGELQLFFLLYLLLLFSFSRISEKGHFTKFLFILILATFTTPFSLIVILGFILYLVLLALERMQIRKEELEAIGFASLFILWYHLIIYKNFLVLSGTQFIWDSIPRELLADFFTSLSLPLLIQSLGFIPLFLGLYGMYDVLFVKRNRYVLLLTSFAFISGASLLIGLLPLYAGLTFVSINLLLLSGYGVTRLFSFFSYFSLPWAKNAFLITVSFFAISFFLIQLVTVEPPQGIDREELLAVQNLSLDQAVILSHIQEGHFLSFSTSQQTFFDQRFVFANTPQQRFEDARTVFQSQSLSRILEVVERYGITHIYISLYTRELYGQEEFFFESFECFYPILESQAILYEIQC